MFRFASKTRLANNSIQPIVRKYCLTSGNAAKDNKHVFRKIPQHVKLMPGSKHSYVANRSFEPCGGESFLQQVHNPTCDGRIDGTKYKSVLSRAMRIEGNEILKPGMDVENLIDGINMAHFLVKKHLLSRARMVNIHEIAQVEIRTEDRMIGELVATFKTRTTDKVIRRLVPQHTKNHFGAGFFFVSEEKLSNNEVEFTDANAIRLNWNYLSSYTNANAIRLNWNYLSSYTNANAIRLNWNYLSSYFVDNKNQTCVLYNPVVLIHENKISNKDILNQAIGSVRFNQPLLIIAEDFDMEMVENLSFDMKVCVLKPNIQDREYFMEDLEFLTGAKVVNGVTSLNCIPQMLGSCKMVQVSYEIVTMMMHPGHHIMYCGLGGEEAFEKGFKKRLKQLRSAIESSTSNHEVNVLEDKLRRLCTGELFFEAAKAYLGKENNRANIVPFYDPLEMPQLQSIEAAFNEGIVAGGGVTLLHASKELDKLYATTAVGKLAIQLFQNALKMPMYTIASSAGLEGSAVVEKLLEHDNSDFGFDTTRGEYVDLIKAGIVDPVKLVMRELDDCVSSFHNYCRMRAAETD